MRIFGLGIGDKVTMQRRDNGKFEITEVDPLCLCEDCGHTFLLSEWDWIDKTCPECGSGNWSRKE